jgi:hypothetical protein
MIDSHVFAWEITLFKTCPFDISLSFGNVGGLSPIDSSILWQNVCKSLCFVLWILTRESAFWWLFRVNGSEFTELLCWFRELPAAIREACGDFFLTVPRATDLGQGSSCPVRCGGHSGRMGRPSRMWEKMQRGGMRGHSGTCGRASGIARMSTGTRRGVRASDA